MAESTFYARPAATVEMPPPAEDRPAGLSSAEAQAQAERGLINVTRGREVRDREVLRRNAFSFFNVVLATLILLLLALAVADRNPSYLQDGLFVGIVAIANTLVATYQEVRATRMLRQLVALTAPEAAVIRDGQERSVPADTVVQGDLLHLRRGDQVVADGPILSGRAEIDESLLSGESQAVMRGKGEELLSGSFCTAGECYYTAERVGSAAYAMRLTADAQQLVKRATPLQQRFNRILRVLLTVTLVLGGLLMISYNVERRGFGESVKATTSTMTTVVPEGLLLGMTVAFAIGAVRVSRKKAIVQDIAAVEALNYIDIVCFDKTGTITANALTVRDVLWLPGEDGRASWVGAFAAESSGESPTAAALAESLGRRSNGARTVASVPFSSQRRWSARALELSDERRIVILGAPETVLPRCRGGEELAEAAKQASQAGLRAVVLAEAAEFPRHETLSDGMRPLALVTLADVLRPGIKDTLAMMGQLGLQPKIISGDNPQTVAALVSQLGLELEGGAISGTDLAAMPEDRFAEEVEANSVFGRIAPDIKARIVDQLKANGHFVAMVGDGANDVRALRAADVAVAMASGTSTARAVAGIVLLEDSFGAFIRGVQEAQIVLGNSARLSKLFLAKSLYAFLIIVATNMLGLNFPFLPRHGSLTALLTLGIPGLFISMSVPPRDSGRDFTRSVLRFALPAAFSLATVAIVVHLIAEGLLGRSVAEARTLVSITLGIAGLLFVIEVLGLEGASWRNPIRPVLTTLLVGVMFAGLLLTLYTPFLRRFFDFVPMGPGLWSVVAIASFTTLAGQFAISRYWPLIIDFLTARPSRDELPRGRATQM